MLTVALAWPSANTPGGFVFHIVTGVIAFIIGHYIVEAVHRYRVKRDKT